MHTYWTFRKFTYILGSMHTYWISIHTLTYIFWSGHSKHWQENNCAATTEMFYWFRLIGQMFELNMVTLQLLEISKQLALRTKYLTLTSKTKYIYFSFSSHGKDNNHKHPDEVNYDANTRRSGILREGISLGKRWKNPTRLSNSLIRATQRFVQQNWHLCSNVMIVNLKAYFTKD